MEGALVIVATLLLARFARHLSRTASRNALWDVQLVLLVGRLVYIVVIAVGILAFIYVVAPGFVGPVLGIVGLLGLAFGLAFQDILKNWLSGFFMLLERPFRIGEEITVGNHSGTVETVLLRVTVLRTADGQRVLVPNQQVFTSAIVDSSSYPRRQFTTTAVLDPAKPLGEVLRRAADAVRRVEGVASEPPAEVSLVPSVEFGPTLEVRYWVNVQETGARAVQRKVSAAITGVATGQKVELGDLDLAATSPGKVSQPESPETDGVGKDRRHAKPRPPRIAGVLPAKRKE